MGYFPMCVDLRNKKVLLVGSGPQIAEKMERLRPFGAELVRCDGFQPELLDGDTAFVVVGDTDPETAAAISGFCRGQRIPVNVVDQPQLCSFVFPALITDGDVTLSVSTGGKAPAAAACLAHRIRAQLPQAAGGIIDWLEGLRRDLYSTLPKEEAWAVLKEVAGLAFELGRPLTRDEMEKIQNTDCSLYPDMI